MTNLAQARNLTDDQLTIVEIFDTKTGETFGFQGIPKGLLDRLGFCQGVTMDGLTVTIGAQPEADPTEDIPDSVYTSSPDPYLSSFGALPQTASDFEKGSLTITLDGEKLTEGVMEANAIKGYVVVVQDAEMIKKFGNVKISHLCDHGSIRGTFPIDWIIA